MVCQTHRNFCLSGCRWWINLEERKERKNLQKSLERAEKWCATNQAVQLTKPCAPQVQREKLHTVNDFICIKTIHPGIHAWKMKSTCNEISSVVISECWNGMQLLFLSFAYLYIPSFYNGHTFLLYKRKQLCLKILKTCVMCFCLSNLYPGPQGGALKTCVPERWLEILSF